MNDSTDLVLIYTTLPNLAAAEAMARHLIEARLAACANIYPGITAVYRWEGAIETATEAGMVLKTPPDRLEALLIETRALHPYEVPALLVLGRASANAEYFAWAMAETRPVRG